MIRVVVVMVDVAVEELETECYAVPLGGWRDPLESSDGVCDAFAVGESGSIAAEAHDVRHARGRGARDHAFGVGDEPIVIVGTIESNRNRAEPVCHRADQSMLRRRRPVFFIEKLDGTVADGLGRLAQLVDRNLSVTPPRDGLLESGRDLSLRFAQGDKLIAVALSEAKG